MACNNKEGEELDWSIFFNRAFLNTLFFVPDYVMVHAVTVHRCVDRAPFDLSPNEGLE